MEHLLSVLSEYGLWVVFIGMIVEGTAVIILSGVLCHMGVLPCAGTLVVAILGAIAGDQIWFYIGRNYAHKFLTHFPSIEKQVEKLKSKVISKSDLLAVTSRFIYSGAILFPLALGMHDYSHKRFTIMDAVGVSLACMAGVSIGYFASVSFQKLLGNINHFEHMLLFIFMLFIGMKLYSGIKKA